MLSKARIAGHPIHPMLVSFPIALFTATIALELAHIGTQDAFYFRAAMIANVAGVVMAVFAALPGLVDRSAVPKESRARVLVNQHATFNLLTVGLYAASAVMLYLRWNNKMMVDGAYALDAHIPLAISMIGFVSMVSAGMLGWTLVQTHHLGIKPAHMHTFRPSREPELDTQRLPARA